MNSPNDEERLLEKLLSGVDVWNQWRAESPNHRMWNGIVLRLDLHRLFDSFLLTIDSKTGQVCLSPSLISSYQAFALIQVRFPEQPMSQNRQRVLSWHNAQCSWFQAE